MELAIKESDEHKFPSSFLGYLYKECSLTNKNNPEIYNYKKNTHTCSSYVLCEVGFSFVTHMGGSGGFFTLWIGWLTSLCYGPCDES